jgi:radical SAM superfamily enzyme YgiQ (UPF0313 family)
MFQDDTLTAFKHWVNDFCKLLAESNLDLLWGCNTRANLMDTELLQEMKRAGLRKIFIGGESSSQRVLDEIYNKGIKVEQVRNLAKKAHDLGIKTQVYFMLGAPTETIEEIRQTIKFAVSLDADEATFSIATPLPETHLYEMMKRDGWKLSENFEDYDYYKKNSYFRGDVSFKKLENLKREALIKFYFSPKRLKSTIKSIIEPSGMKKILLKIKRV